jgi:hypothetical protein
VCGVAVGLMLLGAIPIGRWQARRVNARAEAEE